MSARTTVLGVLVAATVLAACGDVGTAERLSAKETLDGVDVPTIGTVGDFPDPAHRHVVNVTAEGRIVVEGKDVAFDELTSELKTRGDRSSSWFDVLGHPIKGPGRTEGTNPDFRLSGEHVLYRFDGALSWAAAQRVVEPAFDSPRVYRIWLVVRHERDGVEGAVAFPTTLDGASIDPGGSLRIGKPTYGIDVVAGTGDGSPQRLFDALLALPAQEGDHVFKSFDAHFRIDGALTVNAALRLWDAALRSKAATAVGLGWVQPRDRESFATAARRRASPETPYAIYFVNAPQPRTVAPTSMPPVPRVHGPAVTLSPWMYPPDDWNDSKRRLVSLPK